MVLDRDRIYDLIRDLRDEMECLKRIALAPQDVLQAKALKRTYGRARNTLKTLSRVCGNRVELD